MIIFFTGHRNKKASLNDLWRIQERYPGATWAHGGAIGIDTQVEDYAHAYAIPTIVLRPDYVRHGKAAPLVRNSELVAMADVVVAFYDGRCSGGTYYTINEARRVGKKVEIVTL